MIDQALIDAIAAEIEPLLSGVYVGRQHDARELELPAVILKVESEAVVGAQLYRGTLEALVISSADDSTTAQHAALSASVDTALREMEIDTEAVVLCGLVATAAAPDVTGRQFRTALQYTVGYAPGI
jgi:hypothetical protein